MTEKRYYVNSACYLCDTDLSNTLSIFECADKLNELYEENKQLKSDIEKLSYANEDLLSKKRNWQKMSDEYQKLFNENEQLKSDLQNLQDSLWTTEKIRELEKENEQLKQRIDDVLTELYCKDRKLEELGIDIECCDKKGDVE